MNFIISVGSLGVAGANSTVEEVHVSDCSFIGTKNGGRIKAWRVNYTMIITLMVFLRNFVNKYAYIYIYN